MNRIGINEETMDALRHLSKLSDFCNSETIKTLNTLSKIYTSVTNNSMLTTASPKVIVHINALNKVVAPYHELYSNLANKITILASAMKNISITDFDMYNDNISDEESEVDEVDQKIIDEIFQPDSEKVIDVEESPIITLSPIDDRVLEYLSENPESFYQLSDNDFEFVMAEIYSKLGYDVTRTKATRDGGKDLIIRIPDILGDFIYYVECKKYNPQRPIGVGIIRDLVGTINTDRVNGGILATTSYFTKDAKKFIVDNKWNCIIKMHDYDAIRKLLKKGYMKI